MKLVKKWVGFFLSFMMLLSCFGITAFADASQEAVALNIKDQSNGATYSITESQIRAVEAKTVSQQYPWETYDAYAGSYSGTFYSLNDILSALGIDMENVHGLLITSSDSSYCTYENDTLKKLYIFDQSEVENFGFPVGTKGTYGIGYSGGGFKRQWRTDIATIEVAFDCSLTYPGSECQHRCIYCGKQEHYRKTSASIWGYEIYDCQYKINSWAKAGDKWFFIDPDGSIHKGWLLRGSTWYYMDEEGVMVTGYEEINGVPYCFNSSGAMGVGWVKDTTGESYEHKWYYASSSGRLVSGWLALGGKWYYLDPYEYYMHDHWLSEYGKPTYYFYPSSGAMATGWTWVPAWDGATDGDWYYFASSGAMVTGWQYLGGKWYFFTPGGRMAHSEWYGGYWLNANGSWTYPYRGTWHHDGYGWWFGDTSGWYAKNQTARIDDSYYTFDGNGYWR